MARISANGKRKVDSEEGGGGARRERVVEISESLKIIDLAQSKPNNVSYK